MQAICSWETPAVPVSASGVKHALLEIVGAVAKSGAGAERAACVFSRFAIRFVTPVPGAWCVRRTTAALAVAAMTTVAVLAQRPPAPQERSARRLVMDDTHHIPPAEWSYAEVLVPRPATLIQGEFEVVQATAKVRLCLMRVDQLDAYSRSQTADCLAATAYGNRGRLSFPGVTGRYALVVENRASQLAAASRVRLRIWLQSTRTGHSLPAWRQALTIAISLAIFFFLAAYSARKLLPALTGR